MAAPLRNWSREVAFSPRAVERPADEDALARTLTAARAAGRRVRVGGSLHSWSPLAATDDLFLRLDTLPGPPRVDPDAGTVTVGPATPLRALNEALAAAGHALPVLGSIDAQTVAGALATGTHGSSLVHGNLATLVRAMRWVDGTGRVVDATDLPATRVHLGALGVVTRLTLACTPAFSLVEDLTVVPFDTACADAPALARSAEYVKLWWLPHTADVLVFRYHRGEDAPSRTALARTFDQSVVNDVVFAALLKLGAWVPAIVPTVNRLLRPLAFGPRRHAGRSDRVFTIAMPPRHFETEAAIPLEHTGAALDALRRAVETGGHRVNFIQELRFAPADDAWLSGAHGRDTCHLGAYLAGATAGDVAARDRYFADFAAALTGWDPRPHWGKQLLDPRGLLRRYPKGEAFRALAAAHDPDGLFRNPLLDAVFA